MQAETVRARWLLAAGGVAAAVLALGLASGSVTAVPPTIDADVALAAPMPAQRAVLDTARCFAARPTGALAVIALATGFLGPELVAIGVELFEAP